MPANSARNVFAEDPKSPIKETDSDDLTESEPSDDDLEMKKDLDKAKSISVSEASSSKASKANADKNRIEIAVSVTTSAKGSQRGSEMSAKPKSTPAQTVIVAKRSGKEKMCQENMFKVETVMTEREPSVDEKANSKESS